MRQRIAACSEQKAEVVRQLRSMGLSVTGIAAELDPPLTRQAIYNVLGKHPDKRINEQADGTWTFYCPHGVGDVDVQLFPSDVMARQYAEAHDRAIHHRDSIDNVFKHEKAR